MTRAGREHGDGSSAERKARLRQERRVRKKRRRMPVHGAGLRVISQVWQKRAKKDR